MDWIDFWRLCDEFTIVQAALLIAGHDPSHYENSVEAMAPENRPFGYQAVRAALNNSVVAGRLKAKIVNAQEILTQHDPDGEWLYDRAVDLNYPDVGKTVIPAEDIFNFLTTRGFKEGFFAEIGRLKTGSMNPESTFYAPKLAAANKAWTEVTNSPDLLNGKTPKQALKIWLRKNAAEFGLSKDDGNPNEQGIEDICKVANWKPEGGASATPAKKAASKGAVSYDDYDDEIPF